MQITISVTNDNPNTIHNKLKARLGREPSNAELREECQRIMREGLVDLAQAGKLPHQRRTIWPAYAATNGKRKDRQSLPSANPTIVIRLAIMCGH